MPEGDTIHRSARRLHEALAGRTVRDFRAGKLKGVRPRAGTAVDRVEARGKHLLVHFSDGLVLDTHMMMTGAWHVYAPGERWRRAPHLMRVMIETDDAVAVCFQCPLVRTFLAAAARSPVDGLGVDLCDVDYDLGVALARIDGADPATEIGNLLLDQRVVAGIGNVYKSEALYAARVNPFTLLRDLDETERTRIVRIAAGQLQANLGRGRRATHATEGVAVYGRARLPCPACGTPIRTLRQGRPARSTYWCPKCQPARPPSTFT